MYIIKNAITSISRNKGRNILIGIIVFTIALASSVALAINNTSDSLIKSYENKTDIIATIGVNRKNMMKDFNKEDKEKSKEEMKENFGNVSNLTLDDIKNYADSIYVKSYYYQTSLNVNVENLTKAESTQNNRPNKNFQDKDFTLTGYSDITAMNDFIKGKYKITEGEISEDFTSDTCIINSELATLNSIYVGDKIKIIDPEDTSKTYELEVTGIYEETDSTMDMFSNSVNSIITNTNFISKIDTNVTLNPSFVLTNSNVIDKFEEELKEKGLDENLTVQTNLDETENSTKTISNVKTFAQTFLIITLIIGTVILLVINMINIRERKYEIGVLRTIGMKKKSVAMQFLTELLIVSFTALILGVSAGTLASKPVSNYLLQSEITSNQNQTKDISANFGHDDKKFQKTFEITQNIDAKVDAKMLIELLGIGLVITTISSLSSIISIQRFSPLTILKERT